MKTIKVVHILPNAAIGGIQKYVYELLKEQIDNPQLQPTVLFCSTVGGMLSKFQNLNIPLHFNNLGGMDFSISKNRKIICFINKFDIVHWHFFVPVLGLFPFSKQTKHIFTHHSVIGGARLSKKTDWLKWKLFAFFIKRKMNAVIYNSNYTREFWHKKKVKLTIEKLIYNGVNLQSENNESIDEKIAKQLSDKFVIGTSSNFIELKRIDFLIKAFSEFQKNKENVCLLIVGDGYMKNSYLALIEKLGIQDKIIMSGHQLNVTPYQKIMDVCVFPSVTETFGLVAVECLNLGKPVIVMKDGGGIVEVVGEDSSNVVSNIDDLQTRLEFYYNNQDLLNSESLSYKQRAAFFTMDKHQQKVADFYEEVILN